MVEKDSSHPLPACVGILTFHSELHCHPLSCAAANYKHIPNCTVQHNPFVMDLINPSSAPIPPWTPFSAGKGPGHKPLSILVLDETPNVSCAIRAQSSSLLFMGHVGMGSWDTGAPWAPHFQLRPLQLQMPQV